MTEPLRSPPAAAPPASPHSPASAGAPSASPARFDSLPAPAYVISDAHLGFAPADVERALVRFLRHLPGRAGSLLINGDLFEFWFEWRRVMPRGHFHVLSALADLREAGMPVVLVAGNHDCWGGDILRDDVGLDYRLDPWAGNLGGWQARVEHGDGLRGRADRGYRMLRAVIRHPLSIRLFRLLPPDWGSALASGTSHTSRTYQARDGGAGLRDAAAHQLAGDTSIDLLLYGHSHIPELRGMGSRDGDRRAVYANAGPWLDQQTFIRVTPDRLELRRWDESASDEGVHLDAFDRVAQEALP